VEVTIATAVVGGLVFLITRSLLERRRGIAAGRAAARLIEDEFGEASSLIEASIRRGAWLDDPGAVISGTHWEGQRAALAAAPGFKGWHAVTGAGQYLLDIRRRARTSRLGRGSRMGDGDLPEEYVGYSLLLCEIATEALNAYAKTPTYKSERVRDLQRLTNEITAHMEHAPSEPVEPKPPKRLDQGKRRRGNGTRRKGRH
jgi:hypothetical protein